MNRLWAVLAVVSLCACADFSPFLDKDGGADAAPTATTTTDAATPPCQGFLSISGECGDLRCLGTPTCDAANPCGEGLNGTGSCFGGYCAYVHSAQACTQNDQCPCGICGANGRCYEDLSGNCGQCASNANPQKTTPGCKTCLADCAGTGPLCCAGAGCLCEPYCIP
jgi:hypothetical protein